MNTFEAMMKQCGLSRREAAKFFDVSEDSVHSWAKGRRHPPQGVFDMLVALHQQIRNAAYDAAEIMVENGGIDPRAFYNVEAENGFDELPCDGAREAAGALALLIAASPEEWEDNEG